MTPLGITFDEERHTYKDFGLRIKSISIGMPEVKENKIEIPGADGYLDLTDTFGTRYENREIKIECDLEDKSYEKWAADVSSMANYLHGKKRKLVLDWDYGYYYVGRGELEPEKDNRRYSEVKLTFDCDPYKYEFTASDEEWLWDPFDLENGVIREYANLTVNGSLKLTVIGSPMSTEPKIIASAAMTVEYEGETYQLEAGENYLPEVEITEGEHTMTFTGNGTVSVSYRGGSL